MPTATPALSSTTPALSWNDGFPLGNGRTGVMVHGEAGEVRWDLNDDTCWSGSPATTAGRPASDEPSPEVVERVRQALLDGDVETAEREIRKVQHGHSQSYQPLAALTVVTDPTTRLLHRRLDLSTGVARWQTDGPTGTGEVEAFVSAPAGAVVAEHRWERPTDVRVLLTAAHAGLGFCRVETDEDGLTLVSRMPSDVWPSHERTDDPIRFDPAPGRAVTAALAVRVRTDGALTVTGPDDPAGPGRLQVTASTRLTLVVTTGSDFVDAATPPHGRVDEVLADVRDRADAVAGRDVAGLRAEHEADHRALFDRLELVLGDGTDQPDDDTDALLARARGGDVSPALVTLAVQLGRYLMIASSRPGSRASNLQGIWNRLLQPPWSSNYTVNINTEMNYWLAAPGNLLECAEPLHGLVEDIARTGRETARRVYGRPGWAAHHNSDVWGYSMPVGQGDSDPCWAAWPMAGPWLLRQLAEHHRYTGDPGLLLSRGWPLVDGAVEFVLSWLVVLPDGTLGTAPSTSPENRFLTTSGSAAVTVSSTMDLALARDLLRTWTTCAELLGRGDDVPADPPVDPDRRRQVADALARLPLPEPTARGTYPEWHSDLPEAEPAHRHQSHLYDVHPGDALHRHDPDHRARLEAVAETLRLRGSHSTGWSIAWRVALHARLADVPAAVASLGHYLTQVDDGTDDRHGQTAVAGGVYRNLLCAHPPFQIDGNFGVAAGVLEMLVQSSELDRGRPVLDLLPCLPAEWSSGSLRGVRARGGLVLDLTWRDGAVQRLGVTSPTDQQVVLHAPGTGPLVLDLSADGPTWWPPAAEEETVGAAS
ncbi:glycosyl hydrolase family 95 catalytic domain-containing protein [Auraticoccus monumenti]|uniref:Alpha-L-fucosidase 2 n=1 Tax=Auraticoccus monumenti TaxID=675864 RepID=A0A1G7DIZ5_9ACTN|nr:glycoside hydrolase N-terminal domain-containing protein [Auraticoccus monumenti]SDE51463.1 alpha-L-fucosidase 2 [Auraticoccus monumenti]